MSRLSRREFLASSVSAAALQGLPKVARAEGTVIDHLALLYDQVIALSDSSLAKGLTTMGSIYGIYSDRMFQTAVLNSLARIERSLQEINAKLDTIIGLIKQLPDVFYRILELHEQRRLANEIFAFQERIVVFARTYPSPADMPASEVLVLRDQVLEPLIQTISTLRQWGPGAYFNVGFGFSTVAIAAKWVKLSPRQFDVLREQNVAYMDRAAEHFEQLSTSSAKTLARTSELVNAHTGFIVIYDGSRGVWVRQPKPLPFATPEEFSGVYAQLKGSFQTGFSYDRHPSNGSELFVVPKPTRFLAARAPRYSPLVDYDAPENAKRRLMSLLANLSALYAEGHEAERIGPIYHEQAVGARYIAELLRRIEY